MKLVIMTKATFFVEENQILTTLFEEGMENLHLYKPGAEPVYSERLLTLLPDDYHKKISVHDHFYLREEYGLRENPVFDYGEHGKPFIVGHPDIHFNLSHCHEAVACVVADHPVGIDVESVREYKDGVVEYTMNPQELALIAAAERPDAAFVRLWTMKEARLKLTGEGITNDIKQALADSHRYRFTTVERLDHNYIYTVCEERALKVEG